MEYLESAIGFINTAIVPIILLFGRMWQLSRKESAEIKRAQNVLLSEIVASIRDLERESRQLNALHDDASSKFSTVGMLGKLIAIETKLGTM